MIEPGLETMDGPRFRDGSRSSARRRHLRLGDPSESAGSRERNDATGTPPVSSAGPVEQTILRVLNFAVAIGALVLLSPVILLIAILIKLDSRGPVIYRQERVGLDRRSSAFADDSGRRVADLGGRPFTIYKFRTMHSDAERDSGPVWAKPSDGRVTRVGAILRRTRLDEIPQFWNVIRGEMSVVGPRPERPNFVVALRRELDAYPIRHKVPPGITGWAQVNRGYDQDLSDVREKLEYDLEYLQRRSVWFDLLIMLKTIPVMFERKKGF